MSPRLLASCVLLLLSAVTGRSAPEWWTDLGARQLVPVSTRPPQAGESLTLLAPINGVASGQIAIRHNESITQLTARVGPLSGKAGVLPDGVVRVRYLAAETAPGTASTTAPLQVIHDAFVPSTSPLAVAYLTAEIPPGTTPGEYSGTVDIESSAGTIRVPLTVRVSDFVMPGRADLDIWCSLMQSPAQLAFAYAAEPYGEAHWMAIEASTRLLGDLGHHVLFVPVLWHANAGSGPQMIVFRKEGDRLKPDFSRLERYFKMVARECGPQRMLVFGVWGRWMADAADEEGEEAEAANDAGTAIAASVHLTGLNAEGRLEPVILSSDYAANESLWREVYEGVAELAARHLGVPPERIVLGFADDSHPSEAVDAFWRKVAPRSPGWDAWTHNYGAKGPRPALFQIVDTAPPADASALLDWPAPMEPRIEAGETKHPVYISSCRDIQNGRSPAALYYSLPDLAATPQKTGRSVGFARMGLDFWRKRITLVDGTTVEADGYARDGTETRAHPRRVVRNYRGTFTAQGKTGALPLIHFDALREGVQAAQARMLVARAIRADPASKPELFPVLELQMRAGARHGLLKNASSAAIADLSTTGLHEGWEPLYRAAGEAQRRLELRGRDEASARAERSRRGRGQAPGGAQP